MTVQVHLTRLNHLELFIPTASACYLRLKFKICTASNNGNMMNSKYLQKDFPEILLKVIYGANSNLLPKMTFLILILSELIPLTRLPYKLISPLTPHIHFGHFSFLRTFTLRHLIRHSIHLRTIKLCAILCATCLNPFCPSGSPACLLQDRRVKQRPINRK